MPLPGTTEEILWKKDLVFKVAGKMYVCSGMESNSCFSFKCSEEEFNELKELPGIIPAPYLARAHWVQIDPAECKLKQSQIKKLIFKSYDLIVAKLPKKTQKVLANAGD